jgi:glucose/arabinose dehydrogenase
MTSINRLSYFAAIVSSLAVASACGGASRIAEVNRFGPQPELPEPTTPVIPTIKVVNAVGWQEGEAPTPAGNLKVTAFARGLEHPRWLHVLPNGDVLVAETNAPERPEANKGIKGWFFKRYQAKAGGAVPSANRITLLRDADRDGVAEASFVLLSGLNSPFGMALVRDTLYIANAGDIVRVPYRDGVTGIRETPVKVTELPGGPRNHHWTKNIIASPDGSKLYAAVGSNSNIAEHGMDEEVGRAAIWEIDLASGSKREFATGLRNPVGLAWEPGTNTLWTAVNERDELGNDLVPDYITSVKDGGFYGWPYSYFGQHVDDRVKPQRPDLVAKAIKPDYALGAHTASLGLAYSAAGLGQGAGMFVGQHGSWNRNPRAGYKVIFVPFENGTAKAGPPIDILTGFVKPDSDDAMGRPVGVALDDRGGLLVADDVGNAIWRVSSSAAQTN